MSRIRDRLLSYGDLDWFAVDRDGHVGHFSSFGSGCIPRTIAQDVEGYAAVLEYFERAMALTVPVPAETEEATGNIAPWLEMAAKGLYSYDTARPGAKEHPYHLVARPTEALRVSDLPLAISVVLRRTTLATRFALAAVIPEALICGGPSSSS
jgi:hypothetical protein